MLSITNSWSLLKLMSIELVMPSNHLILCRPLFLLPLIFPSIRIFSSESVLHIRWPECWSLSSWHNPVSWLYWVEHRGGLYFINTKFWALNQDQLSRSMFLCWPSFYWLVKIKFFRFWKFFFKDWEPYLWNVNIREKEVPVSLGALIQTIIACCHRGFIFPWDKVN